VKIEIDEGGITVRCRQKSWEDATREILNNREFPPDGYKLIRTVLSRRTRSGAATNLSLDFEHCDSRVAEFTVDEAFAFFRSLEPHKGPRPDSEETTP
jgi:hypothetical protein